MTSLVFSFSVTPALVYVTVTPAVVRVSGTSAVAHVSVTQVVVWVRGIPAEVHITPCQCDCYRGIYKELSDDGSKKQGQEWATHFYDWGSDGNVVIPLVICDRLLSDDQRSSIGLRDWTTKSKERMNKQNTNDFPPPNKNATNAHTHTKTHTCMQHTCHFCQSCLIRPEKVVFWMCSLSPYTDFRRLPDVTMSLTTITMLILSNRWAWIRSFSPLHSYNVPHNNNSHHFTPNTKLLPLLSF